MTGYRGGFEGLLLAEGCGGKAHLRVRSYRCKRQRGPDCYVRCVSGARVRRAPVDMQGAENLAVSADVSELGFGKRRRVREKRKGGVACIGSRWTRCVFAEVTWCAWREGGGSVGVRPCGSGRGWTAGHLR